MTDQLTLLATQRLREMIDHPKWRSGGKLPAEEKLAQSLSLSRPSLRRALATLRNEGRIVSRRGSGNYVQESDELGANTFPELGVSSIVDAENCVRFRHGLEIAMCGEAALRASEDAIHQIAQANERLRESLAQGSLFDADFEFHLAIARATRNPYFLTMMESLRGPMQVCYEIGRRLRHVPLGTASNRVYKEHAQILNAIRSHDIERAKSAMDAHLGETMKRFLGTSDTSE